MGILYVAGDRPGAGATVVAAGLASLWRGQGYTVTVVKPVTLAADDPDGAVLAGLTGSASDASLVLPSPESPSQESDGAEESDKLLNAAAENVQELASQFDAVIVEGVPRLDTTGAPIAASPVLAERLGARVLGVVAYRRAMGADDVSHWRNTYASSFAGVVLNRETIYAEHDVWSRLVPAFEDAGVAVIAVIPEQRLLLAPTVRQVSDLVDGTFFTGLDGEDQLIEHFLIGGLITEWGGNYFGRLPNQAVIVRGGRADIQMSALNFPLTALFLTGCDTPSQYVYQRAQEQNVPLVVVPGDTHATTAALEQLHGQISGIHPEKVELVSSILSEALGAGTLRAAVGLL
jgi:BioD-like phosphotransacetylase family protein